MSDGKQVLTSSGQHNGNGRAGHFRNLSSLQAKRGRYAEAASRFTQSLGISEQLSQGENSLVARSLNNWAEMELLQGKSSAAQPKLERALAIYAKLGLQTSQVAETLHHLAVVYQAQGKYTAAQTHIQRALALWEKERGEDHPTLVHPLQNDAKLLRKMGREEEATKVEARVKDIRTNIIEAEATTKYIQRLSQILLAHGQASIATQACASRWVDARA